MPEANLRLSLHRRLARLDTPAAVADFAEELQDRFGAPTAEVDALLAAARLRAVLRSAGVVQADLGPQAVALTPADAGEAARLARLGSFRNGRVVVKLAVPDPAERVARLVAMLLAG